MDSQNELTTYEQLAVAVVETWLETANRIAVVDTDSAQAAANLLTKELAPRRQAVVDFFEPLVAAAFRTHRALTAKRGEILDRFDEPERIIKQKLAAWHEQQQQQHAAAERAAGAVALLVMPEPEKVNGVAFTETWKAECEDIGALIIAAAEHPHLRPLLQVNTKALAGLVKSLGSALQVPGVRTWQESGVRRTA